MKKLITLFALFASTSSFACGDFRNAKNDSWGGNDKAKHFAVSVPFGALGSYLARDTSHPVLYGTLIGSVPGLIKELSDGCKSNGSGFSTRDMTYNILGSLLGASLGNYTFNYYRTPTGSNGILVGYSTKF